MDRAEAEAIYDSGREACVQLIVDLASRVAQLDQRLERLEAQAWQDSRTSSMPPSTDPPKTRAQRRAEATGEGQRADGAGSASVAKLAGSLGTRVRVAM